MTITPKQISKLALAMDEYPPRDSRRRQLVEQHAKAWGISPSTVYRKLRQANGKHTTVFRDPDKQALADAIRVAAIKNDVVDNADGKCPGTEVILDSLEGAGLRKSDASPATINRIIKREGLLLPHPTVRVEPERVGQVYHMDFSFSMSFLLIERAGKKFLKVVSPKKRMTSKKIRQKLEAQRVMIALQVDGKSRLMIAEYIAALGESTIVAINHCKRAWASRPQDDNPFGGIPEILYSDNGAWAKTEEFATFLRSYGVEHQTIAPGRKWENGKAERQFRSIKNNFESFFATSDKEGQEFPVEVINQHLQDYVAKYNTARHPRQHNTTRIDVWIRGRKENPPMYLDPLIKPEYRTMTRKVDNNGLIRVDNIEYYAGTKLAGLTVAVVKSGNRIAIEDPYTGHRRQLKKDEDVKQGEKRMRMVSASRRRMYELMGKDQFAHDDSDRTPAATPLPNNIDHDDLGGQIPGHTMRVPGAMDTIITDRDDAYKHLADQLGFAISDKPQLKQLIDRYIEDNYPDMTYKEICDMILRTIRQAAPI